MHTKKKLLSVSKAADFLEVSADTLRNWEKQGKLIPERTSGGARRYSLEELQDIKKQLRVRVKTHAPLGLLTITEAAKALRVSPDTLRNWEKRGVIKPQRTKGGFRRYSRGEIHKLQEEKLITPPSPPKLEQLVVNTITPPEPITLPDSLTLISPEPEELAIEHYSTFVDKNFSIGGTLSLTGNSLNSMGSSQDDKTMGVLYIQSNPLTTLVDLFNGAVTIDKEGRVKARELVTEAIKVGSRSAGSAFIRYGMKDIDIENSSVKKNTRILITPTCETEVVLAVTRKVEGRGFTVTASRVVPTTILFDYLLVGEIEPE